MKIDFVGVSPASRSINCELIFTFRIDDVEKNQIPVSIKGELFSEDNFKLGNLEDALIYQGLNYWLNADGSTKVQANQAHELKLNCLLSDKAINHIENYRTGKKNSTKDIVFIVKLDVQTFESNIVIGNLKIEKDSTRASANNRDVYSVYYEYENNFSSGRTNMWLLSANGGANFLGSKRHLIPELKVTIDLMKWVNDFARYLNIGNFIVYEFPQPDEIVFSKALKSRYAKAQKALMEMRTQLNYGEWKMAIIVSRPIFELFKNFEDFKKFLLDNGYSEAAYIELRNSIKSFFGLLSKFYHGLNEDNTETNPEIPAHKEDAYLAYTYSISLLHLISQKLKRS
jgi:hypothetical protein